MRNFACFIFASLAALASTLVTAGAQEQSVGRLVCERAGGLQDTAAPLVYASCPEQWLPAEGAKSEVALDWSRVVGKLLSGQGLQGAPEGVRVRRGLNNNIELVVSRSVIERHAAAGTLPGLLAAGVLSSEDGRLLHWKLTAPSPNHYVVVYSISRDSRS